MPLENHFQRLFSVSQERFLESIDKVKYLFQHRREYELETIEKNVVSSVLKACPVVCESGSGSERKIIGLIICVVKPGH